LAAIVGMQGSMKAAGRMGGLRGALQSRISGQSARRALAASSESSECVEADDLGGRGGRVGGHGDLDIGVTRTAASGRPFWTRQKRDGGGSGDLK
jgi:hypothetical protein